MKKTDTTKTRELIKIMNGLEAMGYQVDSIEMLPEGTLCLRPGQCLINIKASPLEFVSPKSPE